MKIPRIKQGTNNKQFTTDELVLIKKLYTAMKSRPVSFNYKLFCIMISNDLSNLIDRYNKLLGIGKTSITRELQILRYGEIEGNKRFDNYCERQRETNTFEYKQRTYGWTEEDFDKYNQSRAVTKDKCIERHGKEKGLKIWDTYVARQAYTNTVEYFKEKYPEDGYQKWLEYNQEKAKSSRLDWIMEQYNLTEREALDVLASRAPKSRSSRSEELFILTLEEHLGYKLDYTLLTKQFAIWNKYLNTVNFYDIKHNNKIVEFHGDYWHCNPLVYSSDFYVPQAKQTAKEIWVMDYYKTLVATDRSYEVKIVWESDWIETPELVIKELSEWLNTK
jgi:hypothetical protein